MCVWYGKQTQLQNLWFRVPICISRIWKRYPSLNVWCVLSSSSYTRPWTVQITSVCLSYLQFAVNDPDGALPHWCLTVRESRNETFPNRRIGRDGQINLLAPRFTHITPLDILFWVYVKDRVFRPEAGSVDEFLARMNIALASVTPQVLVNTWREVEYRLDILPTTNGAHIERYWTWTITLSSKANKFSLSRILYVLYASIWWWINCRVMEKLIFD
jgi:hypothetical protein